MRLGLATTTLCAFPGFPRERREIAGRVHDARDVQSEHVSAHARIDGASQSRRTDGEEAGSRQPERVLASCRDCEMDVAGRQARAFPLPRRAAALRRADHARHGRWASSPTAKSATRATSPVQCFRHRCNEGRFKCVDLWRNQTSYQLARRIQKRPKKKRLHENPGYCSPRYLDFPSKKHSRLGKLLRNIMQVLQRNLCISRLH